MVDVVEAIATLFGFTPAESFVAIVTSGPRTGLGFSEIVAVRADDTNVWQYDRHGGPDYGAPVYDRPQGALASSLISSPSPAHGLDPEPR